VAFFRYFRVEYYLGNTCSVPEVDENKFAMVTAAVYPAARVTLVPT
jgi:hypothetical protein